ncbi:portal protein [Allorhizobium borbori]|uniref:Cell division protein FtsB n=1 Tax=Allorhizobium borbori TaxID=485907 RepID=A0A7W6P272_9HYPH|nr:portal protein [Allorhizobium borbori]MBB4103566.1 cell division protein FtsB [Allorhizobium borbori]
MAQRTSSDLLAKGRKAFQRCNDYEKENRQTALDDVKFSRLSQQWPSDIVKQRELEKRPVLTINKLKAFIRQVVNDSRQNKPQIKVHPVDSQADPKTADVINGLIRNIEYSSNADVAYDTGIEQSVSGGFGYWRIGMDYAYEDTFDMDICIQRVSNQFSVYGDPDSTSADSSDWDVAFVVDRMSKTEFKAKYKGKKNHDGKPITTEFNEAAPVDFDSDSWAALNNTWVNDDGVMIAEWWSREEEEEEIVKLSNGHVYCAEELFEDEAAEAEDEAAEKYEDAGTDDAMQAIRIGLRSGMLQIVDRRMRTVKKVKQVIMTGVDVLEVNEWPGRYIPIVPVYGDEIILEGKRYFRSLIHDAKDAQRMYNYWQSTATELVALAPRVPWIGRKGTFDSDASRWATANSQSHAYLEYDTEVPIRQALDSGPAAGALQQALTTSDAMKEIMGIYDASLGARSNETSGKAIMARQREGDVSTFHFIDNLARAIRHTGRILIDLIPKVYTGERIVRVIGEDKTEKNVPVNQEYPAQDEDGNPQVDEMGNAVMALHDLTVGKYDLTVTTGPSFTTRREEAASQMTELVRAFPQAAPVVADIMARNFDWPGADEIAKRFEAMNPAKQNQIPPQVQQQLEELTQAVQKLTGENENLKQGHEVKMMDAETRRFTAENNAKIKQADTGIKLMDLSSRP